MANVDLSPIIPTEPDTVVLDFQPDEKQFGRMWSSVGREYVARAAYKSPFQYSITRAVEVHGSGSFDGKTQPASLLIFDVALQTEPLSRKRRIKCIKIEMDFEADVGLAPEVKALAPGRPTTYLSYSVQRETCETQTEGSMGLKISAANIKFSCSRKQTNNTDRTFCASIDGLARPSNDGGQRPNYVKWLFKENISQQSAVPTDVSLALLLAREDGSFQCSTKVSLEVDWVHEMFGGFKSWNSRPQVSHFRPDTLLTRSNGKHGENAIDSDHLDKLLEDEAGLEKFVTIYMPGMKWDEC